MLVPLASTALGSNTPVSKAIVVRLEKRTGDDAGKSVPSG